MRCEICDAEMTDDEVEAAELAGDMFMCEPCIDAYFDCKEN